MRGSLARVGDVCNSACHFHVTKNPQSAKQENSASAAIDPNDRPESALVTLRTAARDAGISESTLRRLVHEGVVPSVRRDGALHITQASIVELRTGARKRGPSIGLRVQDQERGTTAASCFKRFHDGESLASIVMALEVDPAIVEGLWYKWKHLHEIETKGPARCMLEHHGGFECDGLPTAQTGLCATHAARARILSNEEDATLHAIRTGQEISTAVCCVTCGKMADRGVCTHCLASNGSVSVENGSLLFRIGERIVKLVPAEEMKRLGYIPASEVEVKTPAPVTPPATAPAHSAFTPDPMTAAVQTLLSDIRKRAQ
jgi:hypothetical protein